MKKNTKRTIYSILFFLSSFIYFFLAYIGYKKQNIDLSKCSQFTSAIVSKGIDYRHGSKGHMSKVFFIQLAGMQKKLGIYRRSKNYTELLKGFVIGDSVTVYFIDNNNQSENVNIDLIQIEKKGKVIVDKKEYEKKEGLLIYIGIIAGLVTVLLSYLYSKKILMPDKE